MRLITNKEHRFKSRIIEFVLHVSFITFFAYLFWTISLYDINQYEATGHALLEKRFQSLLGANLSTFAILLFSSMVIFCFFRLFLTSWFSSLSTLLFFSMSPVIRSMKSAMYWDFLDKIFLILALVLALLLIAPPHVKKMIETFNNLFLLTIALIVCNVTYLLSLRLLILPFIGFDIFPIYRLSQFLFLCGLLAFLVSFNISIFKLRRKYRVKDPLIYIVLGYSIILVYLAGFLFGRTPNSSPNIYFSLVFLFVLLFSKLWTTIKVKLSVTFSLLLFISLTILVYGSDEKSGHRQLLYFLSGAQSSSQLLSGNTTVDSLLPIGFYDLQFQDLNSSISIYPLLQNLELLAFHLFDYLLLNLTNFKDLLFGHFLFNEPPLQLLMHNNIFLWRSEILELTNFILPVLIILFLVNSVRTHRRQTILVLSFVLFAAFLFLLSRPSVHQWYFVSIFGILATSVSICFVLTNLKRLLHLKSSSINSLFKNLHRRLRRSKTLVFSASSFLLVLLFLSASFSIKEILDRGLAARITPQNFYPENTRFSSSTLLDSIDSKPIENVLRQRIGAYSQLLTFDLPESIPGIEILANADCSLANANIEFSDGKSNSLYRFFVSGNDLNRVYVPLIGSLKSASTLTLVSFKTCDISVRALQFRGYVPSFFIQSTDFEEYSVALRKVVEREFLDITEIDSISYRGFLSPVASKDFLKSSVEKESKLPIGSALLGFAAQGRFSTNFSQIPLSPSGEPRTVFFKGLNRRGVLALGWFSTQKNIAILNRSFSYGNFLLHGSSYRVKDVELNECIVIPPLFTESFVFVSTITDSFSNSFHNFNISMEITEGDECPTPRVSGAFTPSL